MTAFNMCTFFNNCCCGLNNMFMPFNSFSFNSFFSFSSFPIFNQPFLPPTLPSLFSWNNFTPNWNMSWNSNNFQNSLFQATPMSYSQPTMNWNNFSLNNSGWSNSINGNTSLSSHSRATTPVRDTFTRTTPNKSVNLEGYNATKGEKLAKDALSHSVGFTHHCARYVSNALERTGLSNGLRGHGYQMAQILRSNDNFKEISIGNVDYKNLPAGCILVYNQGSQGYNAEYGHVEIATGDGRCVSDGITHNVRKPDAIFMPV